MVEAYAIYQRRSRYIVKRFDEREPGLWAMLGPAYTRETAQKLADSLTRDLEGTRAKRHRSTTATVETPTDGSAGSDTSESAQPQP